MNIKSTLTIILIFLFSGQTLIKAQHGQNREEIQKRKIEFIKKNLQLTAEEEKAFLPIYNEFEKKRGDIIKKKHQVFRNFNKNSLNLSEKDLSDLTDELARLNTKEATLFSEYNKKFKEVLSPMKVMLLYINEHEFKKNLLRKLKNKPPPPK